MRKIKVGHVYTAHCTINRQRVTNRGYYHFRIIHEEKKYYYADHDRIGKMFLGLKLGVTYVFQGNDHPECYWFSDDGISEGSVRFELKGRVKHKELKD